MLPGRAERSACSPARNLLGRGDSWSKSKKRTTIDRAARGAVQHRLGPDQQWARPARRRHCSRRDLFHRDARPSAPSSSATRETPTPVAWSRVEPHRGTELRTFGGGACGRDDEDGCAAAVRGAAHRRGAAPQCSQRTSSPRGRTGDEANPPGSVGAHRSQDDRARPGNRLCGWELRETGVRNGPDRGSSPRRSNSSSGGHPARPSSSTARRAGSSRDLVDASGLLLTSTQATLGRRAPLLATMTVAPLTSVPAPRHRGRCGGNRAPRRHRGVPREERTRHVGCR